eukprot:2230854-Pyramimonas_sp.AAC.1
MCGADGGDDKGKGDKDKDMALTTAVERRITLRDCIVAMERDPCTSKEYVVKLQERLCRKHHSGR